MPFCFPLSRSASLAEIMLAALTSSAAAIASSALFLLLVLATTRTLAADLAAMPIFSVSIYFAPLHANVSIGIGDI